MKYPLLRLTGLALLSLICLSTVAPLQAQPLKTLTFTDLMQFRTIQQPAISDDGAWVAFTAQPDRGDGEVVVRATRGATRYVVPRGSHPIFSADGQWAAMRHNPSFADVEKGGKDQPKRGLALLATATGAVETVAAVKSFAFSADGRYLAYHHEATDAPADAPEDQEAASEDQEAAPEGDRKPGTSLVLRHLATGQATTLPHVRTYAFNEQGEALAYAVASPGNDRDGLYVRDLSAAGTPEQALDVRPFGHYAALTWDKASGDLAFLAALEDADGEAGAATLWIWDGRRAAEVVATAPEGWTIPADNTLQWTDDGRRLFFGYRPAAHPVDEAAEDSTPAAPYDLDAILAERTVDVWHWSDSLINPHQKKQWAQSRRWTYEAVYHRATGAAVALADRAVRGQEVPQNEHVMLARSTAPYLKALTWEGSFFDAYLIDLGDGRRTPMAERLSNVVSLSPEGRYAVYYADRHWHLYDVAQGTTRNLTEKLAVPFDNEDHDYPSEVPGYGVAGWAGDAAVLIYDKYDVWYLPTRSGEPVNMTGGRANGRTFRLIRTDPEQRFYADGEAVLLSSYHNHTKDHGFYRAHIGRPGAARLLEDDKRFRFIAKAREADVYLYSREDYDEFPDLWVSAPDFSRPRKLTDVNPQMADFAWGSAELIAWQSADGIPLQGVVIKPGNYEPGRRYPVVTYFYRFMSQRLNEFNPPVVNHRPSFPLYASDGYIVFLPDVRFEVGRPGFSATKAIVPGVQKLVDMGLADPEALGLHGHSWSGYQTAFMITQTDIFKAAIAGAPVSNMTSAYSGIRWGTGRARQFQYERTQSRLGGTLWTARDRYIDNSPVFFADRINTPVLILHGDVDGAVPWYQSIEYYLALRRLGKDAIFLQYRGEDHHPAAYANKLDWAIKMKEYFDHYLKGAPAPQWIRTGMPYQGE